MINKAMKAREIHRENWIPVERAVLCFIRNQFDNEILLIHKKTGLGAGLVNAPGGRIEPNETPEAAAIREVREEVGLEVDNLQHAGDLYFQFLDGHSIRGYVFVTESWQGSLFETDEADPFWCSESEIPYEKMWTDDSWWLPHMLQGRPFCGRFVFDGDIMLSMSLDIESSEQPEGKPGIPKGVC